MISIRQFVIIFLSVFTNICFAFEGHGFSIDIPPSWNLVANQDEGGMRTYGFQGKQGEEFIIAASLTDLTDKKIATYKSVLRNDDGNARQTQGLTVTLKETASISPAGERDMMIAFQPNKRYSSCECTVFGKKRIAIITLILNEPAESAKLTCQRITQSLKWVDLQ